MQIQYMPGSDALAALAAVRGRPFGDDTRVIGTGAVVPTRFKVGETVAAVLAATARIVADIVAARGGPTQDVSCRADLAAATLMAGSFTELDNGRGGFRPAEKDAAALLARQVTRPWPTRDGGHVLPHLSLPHLQARVLGLLGCDLSPEAVAQAVAAWNAAELEEAIAAARACGGMARTRAEWRAHPHGSILAARPVISIERIGDAPPEPVPGGARPLSGLRVLDLTRILAGPVAARTLAEHGADVLMVAAPHVPQVEDFVRDTSQGKRSCFLDLRLPAERARLRELVREADVFSQGYRPGVMAAHGLSPSDLAELRPGIVYLSVSCYGHGGPLSDRAGWEQVAQTVTGMATEHGEEFAEDGRPTLVPVPVCDYTTGYLGALGLLMALEKRAEVGGSWHVQVSLCRSSMFLQDLGLADAPGTGIEPARVAPFMVETDGGRGRLRYLGPVVDMPATPAAWDRQSPELGADRAAWL